MKEGPRTRPEPLGAESASVSQQADVALYCPRCQRPALRKEWRRVWRYLRSATVGDIPAEVLRHRTCGEMVYVVIEKHSI